MTLSPISAGRSPDRRRRAHTVARFVMETTMANRDKQRKEPKKPKQPKKPAPKA